MWEKLLTYDVNGSLLRVIKNMYEKAKSCVKVGNYHSGNCYSEFFSSDCGLRQGENLSPVMFAIFLNDLKPFLSQYVDGLNSVSSQASAVGLEQTDVDVLFKMFILLYADDTVILSDSAENLQVALDKLCEFCRKWSLTVNANKTP